MKFANSRKSLPSIWQVGSGSIIFAVGALILGSPVHALAGERLDEMQETIERQVVDSDERSRFLEAVEDYIGERDAALTVLRTLIESAANDDLQGDWSDTTADLLDLPELSDADDFLS